jgi:hexokinase
MAPRRTTLKDALDDIEDQFSLPKEDLNAILKRFRDRMEHGLAHDGQDMAMIPSFGSCL